MAHELLRLTQSLYNKPHLVTGSYLNEIVSFLENRNDGKIELAVQDTLTPKRRELNYNPDTKIGWVSMEGPLTYLQYYGLCGPSGPSYQTIRDEVNQMLESGAKYIVLDQDSPGGEAYQAFETAQHIREQANKYDAKIIAYVDGLSASASYVFSSVADEIIMNPQAEVGSIGVVVKLRNVNEAMKKMGVEDTYIYAGDSKVPFDSEGKFSEGFLSDIQEKVNVLYEEFASHVSGYRNLSKEAVVATQAKTFVANKAIELGLADKQMTINEFAEYLADLTQEGVEMPLGNLFKSNPTEESIDMSQIEDLQKQLSEMEGVVAELNSLKETHQALLANFESQSTALAEALENVAKMEQEKEKSKADLRKEKLSAAGLSVDEAESMQASLAVLEDDAFSSVLSVLSAQKKVLETSDLMTEMGSESLEEQQPDNGGEKQLSTTQKLILQRLGKSQN